MSEKRNSKTIYHLLIYWFLCLAAYYKNLNSSWKKLQYWSKHEFGFKNRNKCTRLINHCALQVAKTNILMPFLKYLLAITLQKFLNFLHNCERYVTIQTCYFLAIKSIMSEKRNYKIIYHLLIDFFLFLTPYYKNLITSWKKPQDWSKRNKNLRINF